MQQHATVERTRSAGCADGDVDSRKLRPVSVIGGVDLLNSNVVEKDDRLPSVSICFQQRSHRD